MALPELLANSPTPGASGAETTLATAVTDPAGTSISVAAAARPVLQAAGQFRLEVDSEVMLVTGGSSTTTWTVVRGVEGSTAATHASGAPVYHVWTAGGLDARYSQIPSWAGSRPAAYDGGKNLYGSMPAWRESLRALIAKASTGSLVSWAAIGDSRTAGTNVGAVLAWPVQARKVLAGLGVPVAGTGLMNPATGVSDTRIVGTGSYSLQNFWTSISAGGTFKFVSDLPGTIVDVYAFGTSSAFTVKIDSATAVATVPNGVSGVQKISYTGLSNAVHTVTLTFASGGYLIGADVHNASGLEIHNCGIFGFTASGFSGTGFTNPGEIVQGLSPNIVSVELGTNDEDNTTVASFATNMAEIISNYPSAAKLLIAPSPHQSEGQSTWGPFLSAIYDLADANTIPLIDMADRFGSSATAEALGLLGSDALHETAAGHFDKARAILDVL